MKTHPNKIQQLLQYSHTYQVEAERLIAASHEMQKEAELLLEQESNAIYHSSVMSVDIYLN